MYGLNSNVIYFDSFGVEHIPKEITKFIDNENIQANIFRIQAHNSVMCGYFYTGCIDFMLKNKSLTDFTNLFSPNDFKKDDNIILNYANDSSNIYPSLNNQQFRLNKISEVRDYFIGEIKERELMSKKLSKYIAFLIILVIL